MTLTNDFPVLNEAV